MKFGLGTVAALNVSWLMVGFAQGPRTSPSATKVIKFDADTVVRTKGNPMQALLKMQVFKKNRIANPISVKSMSAHAGGCNPIFLVHRRADFGRDADRVTPERFAPHESLLAS